MMNEEQVRELLKANDKIMEILRIVQALKLKDSWLCAGTIRNFLWDYLTNQVPKFASDVDVAFYDKAISYEETLVLEQKLKKKYPQFNWELKNQAFMHLHNPDTQPYKSAQDAIARFPEKCTAIGARLDEKDEIELFLPYGLEDILQMIVQPTPYFLKNDEVREIYNQRVDRKNWVGRYSGLRVFRA